jgi:hypothetical protein
MPYQSEIANLEVALRGEEQVGGFEIAVHEAGGVQVVQSEQQLIEYVLAVHFLEGALVNGVVEISAHELEYQIDVPARDRRQDLVQLDDVRVLDLLEHGDLAEGALGIGAVLERLEYLLQRQGLPPLTRDLPDVAVCT